MRMNTKPTYEELEQRIRQLEKIIDQSNKKNRLQNIEHRQLLSIFNSLDQPIYVSDPETYKLLFANKAFIKIWGDAVGKKCHKVIQDLNTPCPFCTNNIIFGEFIGRTHISDIRNKKIGRFFHCIDSAIAWPNGKMVRFELALDITDRKFVETEFKNSENRFRTLVESTPAVIWIADEDGFLYVNPAGIKFTGYAKKELYSIKPGDIIHPEMQTSFQEREQTILKGEIDSQQYDIKLIVKNGSIKWLEYTASIIEYYGVTAIVGSGFDITSRKTTENALKTKREKLSKQTEHLAELNTALKVLIEHQDNEKQQLKNNIQTTMEKLIFPYLEGLEHARLNEKNKTFLKIIRLNLETVFSPFANTLHHNALTLTPTEIQVADLIKQGKTNKEIASFLIVSSDTISFHRKNIRKKLALTHSKINLRTHLLSLSLQEPPKR